MERPQTAPKSPKYVHVISFYDIVVFAITFFLLDAAWVRSRAERPSVSYTKVTGIFARTGHTCISTKANSTKQISGSNKLPIRGREDGTDARAVRSNSLARRIE